MQFDGVEILATVRGGMSCAVVGNQIESERYSGGVDIWLDSGTKNCVVANKGPVKDEGNGNKVIVLP